MRINNSLKNIFFSVLSNILTIIAGVISQAIFIRLLGVEYLGLNGLFNNVLSMLCIVELGIGNAIIFSLYKPLAEKNIEKIKSLILFYKKSYRIIISIIFVIGIAIIPCIPFFIEEISLDVNITLIYLLFLFDTIFSYVLTYKRSVLYADQKNYIVNIVHIGYIFFNSFFQILILYLTKNYYLYLVIRIISRFLENFIVTMIANKKYSYLTDKNIQKLDKTEQKGIIKKIKSLFFHKIGTFMVQSTDNIIISKFLGLVTVGLYSNYFLIINSVQGLFNQIIQAMTSSVGNMLVTENSKKCYFIFNKIRFLNFWLSTFASISILIIIDSFITIWVGKEYILPYFVVWCLSFNMFQKLMRNSYSIFKEAAGIFYEDRFIPLIESFLNIVFSIILCKYIGLAGVFIGTIISGLALWCYSYPKFVYKKLFNRSYLNYVLETIGYVALFLLISLIMIFINTKINFNNLYTNFIFNVLICIGIPNLILLIIFFRTKKFQYFLSLFKKIIKKG